MIVRLKTIGFWTTVKCFGEDGFVKTMRVLFTFKSLRVLFAFESLRVLFTYIKFP